MFTISVTAHRKIGTFWFSPTVENYDRELSFKKIKVENLIKTQTTITRKNKTQLLPKRKNARWKMTR